MKFIKLLSKSWMKGENISIACLSSATNTVYLVFDERQFPPQLVIKLADSQVLKAYSVIEELYTTVGDLVSKPIEKVEYEGRAYVIEAGMNGAPWFQISNKYETKELWGGLRRNALNALNRLYFGIQMVDEWTTFCRPGDELRNVYRHCCELGVDLPSGSSRAVDEMSKELDQLERIKTWCQHGDYCLNNLLVEVDDIHIIDFEDFGVTSMLLHDEISLGLSMYLSAPSKINTSIQLEVLACVRPAIKVRGVDEAALPGFYLHHLLLRLGEWSMGEKRREYRLWLLDLLREFLKNPREYFCINCA